MLKREIRYTNFDGDEKTDVVYFNLSKTELIELEVQYQEGLSTMIENIIKAENHQELIKWFKEIILLAYGKKSEDGNRFVKSDELRTEFSQTAAFDALFMELGSNENAAATFLKGVLPQDMIGEIEQVQAKMASLPTTPTPPTPPSG